MSIKAIEDRRSIRKYKTIHVPIEIINKIINAGILAPSGKNRQPWKFIVVGGEEKENMLKAFQNGIDREKNGDALLPGSRAGIADAQNTKDLHECCAQPGVEKNAGWSAHESKNRS